MNTFAPPTKAVELPASAYETVRHGAMSEQTSPVQRLGNVLRRRWLLLVLCSLATTILAGVIGISLPVVYTARAQILIMPPAPIANGNLLARPDDTAISIETDVSAMSSRDQINHVLDHLIATADFPIASFAKDGKLRTLGRSMGAALLGSFAGGWIESLLTADQAASLHQFVEPMTLQRRREQILDELERNLKINSEPRSRVISVRYTASRAEIAAVVANTVIETFIEDQIDRKRDNIRRDMDRLDKQLPDLRRDVEAANAQIHMYRMDHAIPDNANMDQQEEQAVVLKGKINATRQALSRNAAEQAALADLRAGPRAAAVETHASSRIALLQEREARTSNKGASATGDQTALDADRRQLRQDIVAESDLAIARLRQESEQLANSGKAFQRQLDLMESRLNDIQPAADNLRQLTRLADAKRRSYEDELLRQQALIRSQDLVSADATMLSAAAPPQKPASASPILFLPPALVMGLLAAGFAAIWLDGRDTTLRSERAVYSALGVPCVGFTLAAPDRDCPPSTRLTLQEAALRSIFAATVPLDAARQGRNLVLVTSSVSGESSLDLAREFAVYAAKFQSRVLLMNLAFSDPIGPREPPKPTGAPGWATDHGLDGMVLTQPFAGLPIDVLAVDNRDKDPLDYLVGRDLRLMFRPLREQYSCIVVQAGPILESSEAQLLAGEADRILLAIRWGRTPRHLVENALALLERADATSLKLGSIRAVLTQVRIRRHLTFRYGDVIEAMARSHLRRRSA